MGGVLPVVQQRRSLQDQVLGGLVLSPGRVQDQEVQAQPLQLAVVSKLRHPVAGFILETVWGLIRYSRVRSEASIVHSSHWVWYAAGYCFSHLMVGILRNVQVP